MASVTAIILTYNSISKLKRLFDISVKSLLKQSYEDIRFVFVDNGSGDDTINYLRRLCGEYSDKNCYILGLGKNYGWPGGNNRGAIKFRDSDLLFFVNDDIILERDCVKKLVEVFENNEDVGSVQPIILQANGSILYGLDVGIGGLAIPALPKSYPLSEVFYASGAAMMTPTRVFFEVGMFDENLFLYHDDLDYGWRVRLYGYKNYVLLTTVAYHIGGATLGLGSPNRAYYINRNNLYILFKNSNLSSLPIGILFALLESFIVYVLRSLVLDNVDRAKAAVKGVINGLLGPKTRIDHNIVRKGISSFDGRSLHVDLARILTYRAWLSLLKYPERFVIKEEIREIFPSNQ